MIGRISTIGRNLLRSTAPENCRSSVQDSASSLGTRTAAILIGAFKPFNIRAIGDRQHRNRTPGTATQSLVGIASAFVRRTLGRAAAARGVGADGGVDAAKEKAQSVSQ